MLRKLVQRQQQVKSFCFACYKRTQATSEQDPELLKNMAFQKEVQRIDKMRIQQLQQQDPNFTPTAIEKEPEVDKQLQESRSRQQNSNNEDDNAAVWSSV